MRTALHVPLFPAIIAMIMAQLSKVFIERWKRKTWNWSLLFRTGSMPSSHTALVTALTGTLWLSYGWRSPWVSTTTVVAMIVMHDAIGVRRQAGEQAVVIYELVHQVQISGLKLTTSDILHRSRWRRQGHTPLEVVGGLLIGVVVAWLTFVFDNPAALHFLSTR